MNLETESVDKEPLIVEDSSAKVNEVEAKHYASLKNNAASTYRESDRGYKQSEENGPKVSRQSNIKKFMRYNLPSDPIKLYKMEIIISKYMTDMDVENARIVMETVLCALNKLNDDKLVRKATTLTPEEKSGNIEKIIIINRPYSELALTIKTTLETSTALTKLMDDSGYSFNASGWNVFVGTGLSGLFLHAYSTFIWFEHEQLEILIFRI
ncbi:hypothetical protein ACOME3_004523 [Neoechinorhynchus agilis]